MAKFIQQRVPRVPTLGSRGNSPGFTGAALTGDVVLDASVSQFLLYSPGGASRAVTLPDADAMANSWLFIRNTGGGGDDLNLDYGGAPVGALGNGDNAFLISDGSSWAAIGL